MSLGKSSADIMNQLANDLVIDYDKAAVKTELLRWINDAQRDMFNAHEWSELRVADASFTADGSKYYDLTSEIDANFGRVRDKSVRVGTRFLMPKPKSWFDEADPEGTQSGDPFYYDQVNRTDFRLWPLYSGTCNLDYIRYPDAITAATVADDIIFDESRHDLIFEGALWRGIRRYGLGDWKAYKEDFKDSMKDVFGGTKVHFRPKRIVPSF